MRNFIFGTLILLFVIVFLAGCGNQTQTREVYTQEVIEQTSSSQDTTYMDTGFEVVD